MFAPKEPDWEPKPERRRENELVAAFADSRGRMGAAAREQLRLIVQVDDAELYVEEGARNTAHWLCMYLGVSSWKAHRLIATAHALEQLPLMADALVQAISAWTRSWTSAATPRRRTNAS